MAGFVAEDLLKILGFEIRSWLFSCSIVTSDVGLLRWFLATLVFLWQIGESVFDFSKWGVEAGFELAV